MLRVYRTKMQKTWTEWREVVKEQTIMMSTDTGLLCPRRAEELRRSRRSI